MSIRVNLFIFNFISQNPKSPNYTYPSALSFSPNPGKTQKIGCKKRVTDAELASDLASEVKKMNIHIEERQEAMKKSREMLFSELCNYLSLRDNEVKKKWRKLGDEEKLVLVRGFVSDWGLQFHPLSAKSVKELVDQHLIEEKSFK
ncbi:hypothetical protein RJ641_013430 [Dillenia turbinata]|uniref:DUF7026 domain-containing protein n=1 Tax=Dillenia turbinata TaxID=194707 RepID=A0AAN8ZQ14_9MAGN